MTYDLSALESDREDLEHRLSLFPSGAKDFRCPEGYVSRPNDADRDCSRCPYVKPCSDDSCLACHSCAVREACRDSGEYDRLSATLSDTIREIRLLNGHI